MAPLRFALRLTALIAALLFALPLHGLWRVCRCHSPWPRRFLAAVARIVGARPQVVGTPRRRDVVFVANHLSWLDIPLLAGATGSAFVARADLRQVPVVGWLCTLNRTLFVEREDRLGVREQIERLRTALAAAQTEGAPVAIFPEGTTGDGVALLPFKAALLAALHPPPAGLLVQPVRIDYGDATGELAWTGDESGRHHARRVLERRGTFRPTLHFLDPFDPAALPGRKAIAAEARARIAAAGEGGVAPV
jgi:1-acyl-sn-glycerol-3-phosphate acyltransferase